MTLHAKQIAEHRDVVHIYDQCATRKLNLGVAMLSLEQLINKYLQEDVDFIEGSVKKFLDISPCKEPSKDFIKTFARMYFTVEVIKYCLWISKWHRGSEVNLKSR